MKEWIGKSCKIQIYKDGQKLFFTAKIVTEVTDTHITFLDKFNKLYTYNVALIEEIHKVDEDEFS